MPTSQDRDSYLKFCTRQNLDKYFHQLEGVLRGMVLDGKVSRGEATALRAWRKALGPAGEHEPFREVAHTIDRIMADGRVTANEVKDLIWVAERFTTPNAYYNAVTADIQRLHGLSMGLLADGVLTDDEVVALSDWLNDHEHLHTVWPYDELCSLMTQILADGHIDEDERALLAAFLADIAPQGDKRVIQFAGIDLKSMSLPAICAMNVEIPVDRSVFCFTGACERARKSEIRTTIEAIGGEWRDRLTGDVNFLVVGAKGNPCWAFAKYGRKIERAMNLRRYGDPILIVHETDFWDAVLDYE